MATSAAPSQRHSEHLSGQGAIDKVRGLLDHFRSAMLTTVVQDQLHTRPMGLLGEASEFNGSLYFFTRDDSPNVRDLERGAAASLIFQCDKESAYMQLSGHAAEYRDKAKMQELFTPLIGTWFPDGLNDPHLTLIRFDAEAGHFWESPGGMIQVLAAFTRTRLTGRPARGGVSGDVQLS